MTNRAEKAERERDAAVERAEAAEREPDKWRADLAAEQWKKWEHKANEWKARAEQAEQLIPAYAMLDIWVALGRDSIHFDDWYDEHGYADAWAELTSAVREARTAPAVSRDDIENAIRTAFNQRGGGYTIWHVEVPAAGVCDLLGIEAEQAEDPVEEKARELYRAATPDARWETVADEYRRIARHVLGQEDRHVDR